MQETCLNILVEHHNQGKKFLDHFQAIKLLLLLNHTSGKIFPCLILYKLSVELSASSMLGDITICLVPLPSALCFWQELDLD